jgi:hypothetical protein
MHERSARPVRGVGLVEPLVRCNSYVAETTTLEPALGPALELFLLVPGCVYLYADDLPLPNI